MRRIRYSVTMSLDGFIAGPNGEYDWILMDPEIDFAALFSEFDTAFIGRNTFMSMIKQGQDELPGIKTYLFSKTLDPAEYPQVTVVAGVGEEKKLVDQLKSEPGKDIWLFGGGVLFQSLAGQGLVDTVEVAIIPVLLGEGIPLRMLPADCMPLKLTKHRLYENTGTLSVEYEIVR